MRFLIVYFLFSNFMFAESLETLKSEYKALPQKVEEIPFSKSNPYSKDKEELGKLLFFDTRLSGFNGRSCATCHNPGLVWSDGMKLSIGDGKKPGPRKTPTLFNLAWQNSFPSDGKFNTLVDQALGVFQNPKVMNIKLDHLVSKIRQKIPGYLPYFERSFGSARNEENTPEMLITPEHIGKAIDVFQRTLVSGIAPFDKWIGGDETAINDKAKKGFVLFHGKGNCAACHSGNIFSDGTFHDIGVRKTMLNKITIDKGDGKFGFKVSPLREVAMRPSFMHNGSLMGLKAVIDFYDKGGEEIRPSLSPKIKKLNLTEEEKDNLVEFIKTLVSPMKDINVPTKFPPLLD